MKHCEFKDLRKMEKFNELIKSDIPVLIDFYAEWCGPCKAIMPVLEKVKEKLGDKARIVKIDVDKFQELAEEYHIQTVPTFIIFKKGESLWRHSGMIPEKELVTMIEKYI